jgi:hypothetical protein
MATAVRAKAKAPTHADYVQRIKASQDAKADHLDQWYTNIAYFKGKQWPEQALVDGNRYVSMTGKAKRKPVTVNYVQPIVLTLMAKLTQNRPLWDVRPASPELSDKKIARCGCALLHREWDRLNLQQLIYESAGMMLLTGQTIWIPYWDDEGGEEIIVRDPMTNKEVGRRKTGAPIVDHVLPMDFGMDPLAATPEAVSYAYRIRLVTRDWIKEVLDQRLKENEGRVTDGDDEIAHRKESSPILQAGWDDERRKKMVPLYEFYDLERGKLLWLTRDRIVAEFDWKGGNPFIVARAIPNFGDVEGMNIGSNACWGETPVSQMIPLQRELNIMVTQKRDIRDRLIQPTLLIPRTAKMDISLLQTGRARYLEWSGLGQAPTPLNQGGYPGFLNNDEATIIEHLKATMAVSDITMSGSSGAYQSGRSVALQSDQDAQRYGPYVRSLQYLIEECGKRILHLYHQYADDVIMAEAVGSSGDLEYMEFLASDLNTFRVQVVAGSMFAQNKALRMDQVLQMWQMGIEKDPRMIKRMLEFGTVEELMGGTNSDRIRQRREISAMRKGIPMPVEAWDVHDTHLEELDEFLKSAEYEQEPDEVKALLRAHREEHMQAVQMAAMGPAAADGQMNSMMAGLQGGKQGTMAGVDMQAEANPQAAAAAL